MNLTLKHLNVLTVVLLIVWVGLCFFAPCDVIYFTGIIPGFLFTLSAANGGLDGLLSKKAAILAVAMQGLAVISIIAEATMLGLRIGDSSSVMVATAGFCMISSYFIACLFYEPERSVES